MRRRTAFAASFALLLSGAPRARADEPNAAARAAITLTAVKLAEEAGELYQAGKFEQALDRYERADALVRRHTIGLRIARCLTRLGRLNEAAERYSAVTRMPLPADLAPDKRALQKEALSQAESEGEALLPRIAGVIVQLSGPPDTIVTLDGQPFPAALLGMKRAIDPGAHHLEGRAGAEVITRDVVLKEGEVVSVSLELHGAGAPPSDVASPVVPLPESPPASSLPMRRALGFAAVGVGAAGLGVGLIAGALAVAKKGALDTPAQCGAELKCPSGLASDAHTYNTERNVASAGIIAGGILAAAGVALVLTAPSPRAISTTSGRTYTFFAGPAGGGVRGAF